MQLLAGTNVNFDVHGEQLGTPRPSHQFECMQPLLQPQPHVVPYVHEKLEEGDNCGGGRCLLDGGGPCAPGQLAENSPQLWGLWWAQGTPAPALAPGAASASESPQLLSHWHAVLPLGKREGGGVGDWGAPRRWTWAAAMGERTKVQCRPGTVGAREHPASPESWSEPVEGVPVDPPVPGLT